MSAVRRYRGDATGRARSRSSFIGHPQRSAVSDRRRRLWTVPELWKTHTTRFPQARWTAHRTRRPQRPTGRAGCDGTKNEEQRTESGYNDARVSRRLTRLTSRSSLRSDHDRWTARSRWSGRSDHDGWNAQLTPLTRQRYVRRFATNDARGSLNSGHRQAQAIRSVAIS